MFLSLSVCFLEIYPLTLKQIIPKAITKGNLNPITINSKSTFLLTEMSLH